MRRLAVSTGPREGRGQMEIQRMPRPAGNLISIVLAMALFSGLAANAAAGEAREPLVADVSAELEGARKAWREGDNLQAQARADFSVLEKQEQAYEKAAALFRQALQKDRCNPHVNCEFARFWLARREFTQARAHLELARNCLEEEQERATESKTPVRHPFGAAEEADLCRTLGGLLERAREYPQAMALYRQALKLDPRNARNAVSLAIGLCAGGHPDEAAALLEPLAGPPGKTPVGPPVARPVSPGSEALESLRCYTLAVALEELGRLDDALERYRQAMKLAVAAGVAESSGVGDHALMAVGRLEDLLDAMQEHTRQREAENTQRQKKHLKTLPPVDERADFATAAYRCAEGVKLKGIALGDESFVRALARVRAEGEGEGAETAGNAGGELQKQPMFETFMGAMQAFQEARMKCPRFARAHYELALCNLLLGRYGSARALADAAALYSPNDLATLSVQGEVLLELGQWEDAASAYRRMLSLEHESGAANFGLARALAGSPSNDKDVQMALDALDRAASLGVRDRRMQQYDHVLLADGRELDGKLQFDKKENLYLLYAGSKTFGIGKERIREIQSRPGLREELLALKARLDRGEKIETGPVVKGSSHKDGTEQESFFRAGSIYQP